MELAGLSLLGAGTGVTGGKIFNGVKAADGSPLPGDFHSASHDDVNTAARLAAEAFATYGRWPAARRAGLLRAIAARLEANAAAIVARAALETALPEARLQGELGRTCFQLRLYGGAAESGLALGARIDHGDPARKPLPKPDLRSLLRPIGPVAVFGASNFPLAFSVAGGDTASALAAGCPVVVKAHPGHPGTSEMVGRLVAEAVAEVGAPEGVFSLLFDAGHEIGAALVTHPCIRAVGFTGSITGGRALMDIAAARPDPIPVFAEMGSVNPMFLLRGAIEDRAEQIAAGLHASITGGVGQFCTKPGIVFVEETPALPAFLTKLSELVAATPAGVMLHAGIREAYIHGVQRLQVAAGVDSLGAPRGGRCTVHASLFITNAPTFLTRQDLWHEVFGPTALVVRCASVDEMLAAAAALDGQLTASVHARPAELAEQNELVELLATRAGRVIHDGFPTGVEVAHAMVHGGPWPATSDGRSSSVGTSAISRFQRPVCYQNFPDAALPEELREANPLRLPRLVDGVWTGA